MARLLFPGGVLVAEKPWEHATAAARTAALMADRSVPAIFEAAFEHSACGFASMCWNVCRAGIGECAK